MITRNRAAVALKATGPKAKKKRKISSSSCSSQSTAAAATSWPSKDPTTKTWPKGLLEGLDEATWNALARVTPEEFCRKDQKQQPAIRAALRLIGMGWVATNTTPYRTAFGGKDGKFQRAKAIHEANGFRPPKGTLSPVTKVDFDDIILPKEGDLDSIENNAKKIESAIDQYGVVVVRKLLEKEVQQSFDEATKRTKLADTTGSGVAGSKNGASSYYADITSKNWTGIQNNLLSKFLSGETLKNIQKSRKAIALHYAEGAENWAHKDGLGSEDKDFPFQATVMVSTPGQDFTGGEFYVACKQSTGRIQRTRVEFENPGDVVFFRADTEGGWDHGMLPVRKGSGQKCERVSIGLFQKKW